MTGKAKNIAEVIHARVTRRELLHYTAGIGALAAFSGAMPGPVLAAEPAPGSSSLTFREIAKGDFTTHQVAPGYQVQLIARWGERLFADAPLFSPPAQSAAAQTKQFGQNCDFTAYLPFHHGSQNSRHGLLHVNHEFTLAWLMFPGLTEENSIQKVTAEQVAVEKAAQGFSLAEIRRNSEGKWQVILGSPLNRRVTAETPVRLSGPAAGHDRLKTKSDPSGKTALGTYANCAGGVTPWGTVLTAEENFHDYFHGQPNRGPEAQNHKRYEIGTYLRYGWYRFDDRFDIDKAPTEANRFGWIVEYDPYDPESMPTKRTALGRFAHESATCAIASDGRIAVYSGDDARFEYVYRFVTARPYDPKNRAANKDLLDEGELSVAKFHEDGSMEWLPLVHGQGPLTAKNGFNNQGDVLIEARRAADLLGATPMDRPEDFDVHPTLGTVYCVMTKNPERKEPNAANARVNNIHGHILTLSPPAKDGGFDHTARHYRWDVFLEGGDPSNPKDGAKYLGPVSENGWLSTPDNLAIDPRGRLWIGTDGQPASIGQCDGLYAADTEGPGKGITRLFFTVPRGAEMTGPSFTPDGKTLFLSVQHPAEGTTFDSPSTRWPDFNAKMPPRSSVLAIVKEDGGEIGS